MKEVIYVLLIIFCCIGCSANYNYEIAGTVKDSSLDGEYIYLQEISEDELVTIDSALVTHAKFTFKGNQEMPVIRELSFPKQDLNNFSPVVFVLQSGKLTARIDTVSTVTGTEQNDRLQKYFHELNYYQTRINDLVSQYQLLTLSDEVNDSIQNAFQEWYDSIRDELNKLSYDFILINSNSVAGGLVFLQSYSQLTPNQVETILHSAGPDFRSIHGVNIVEEQLRREKQVAVGNQYIDFTMNNAVGEPVTLSSFIGKGNWVLLDFWASWCLPCEQDLPFIQKIYKEFGNKGLTIVGISLDTNRASWLRSLSINDTPWTQLSDLKGWESEAAIVYGIQTLPYTILINPDGIISARGIRYQSLGEELQKLFSDQSGS